MKYAFITQQKNTASISLQCQVLGVNRSGYYHYRANVSLFQYEMSLNGGRVSNMK